MRLDAPYVERGYHVLRFACRELCNECHTSDNYELNNGIVPGSLLYNWQVQQAAFLKHTIGVQQVRGRHPGRLQGRE